MQGAAKLLIGFSLFFVVSGSICLQGWKSELICIVKVISPVKRASFIFE